MNRNFVSVILGGFGGTTGPAMEIAGEMVPIDVDGVAAMLDDEGPCDIVLEMDEINDDFRPRTSPSSWGRTTS